MRRLAVVVLWLVLLLAWPTALLFGAVIVFGEDAETRLGGALLAAPALGLALGSRALLKRLRRSQVQRPVAGAQPLPAGADGDVVLTGHPGVTLRLDSRGFECWHAGGTLAHSWGEVTDFRARGKQIGLSWAQPRPRSLRRRLQLMGSSVDDLLPGSYDRAEEVAALMENYRHRYASSFVMPTGLPTG